MTEDAQRSYDGIYWHAEGARVTGFTTAGSRGTTTVTIKMDVTSSQTLGTLVSDLADLRDKPAQPKRKRAAAADGEIARG